MKEWCGTSFYCVANTKKGITEEIQQLDTLEESQDLIQLQFELRTQLKAQLKAIVADEETMWKARSRQQWLQKGDGNTKFFHATANARRRANAINVIEANSKPYYREEDKRDIFYSLFKELFSSNGNDNSSTGDCSSLFSNKPIGFRNNYRYHSQWKR